MDISAPLPLRSYIEHGWGFIVLTRAGGGGRVAVAGAGSVLFHREWAPRARPLVYTRCRLVPSPRRTIRTNTTEQSHRRKTIGPVSHGGLFLLREFSWVGSLLSAPTPYHTPRQPPHERRPRSMNTELTTYLGPLSPFTGEEQYRPSLPAR